MRRFSPETVEPLGSYVYALLDPRKLSADLGHIFYVGKGKGQRCFHHAEAEEKEIHWKENGEPNPKFELIRQIRFETTHRPPIRIIAHGLDEKEAFLLEAVLISILKTEGNLVSGKYDSDYNLTLEEIDARYSNPLDEQEIRYRVLLVSLNGNENLHLPPFPGIQRSDLAQRVLGYWRMSEKKAMEVEYVVGVYQQLTRVVFKVRQKDGRAIYVKKPKVLFEGDLCPKMMEQWGNRRIVNSDGALLTKFLRQRGWQLIGTHS